MVGPPPGTWDQILGKLVGRRRRPVGQVEFDLDDELYLIPPASAAAWLDALSTGDPLDVVPGMCEKADREAYLDRFWDPDDPLDLEVSRKLADHVLAEVTGLSTYTVSRLVHDVVRPQWVELDGWCAAKGIDPLVMPFGRFLRLVYSWLVRNVDSQEGLDKIHAELFEVSTDMLGDYDPDDEENLPPGWDAESTGAAWQAAAGGLGGG